MIIKESADWSRGDVALRPHHPLIGKECARCSEKFEAWQVVKIKVDCLVRHVDCEESAKISAARKHDRSRALRRRLFGKIWYRLFGPASWLKWMGRLP